MNPHTFLVALTVVLCTAGVTTVLCQRVRLPVVLGYILAGLIVGPYVPIPLVADRQVVETLAEVGVILLMFCLGLEFRLNKLVRAAPTAGLTALIQTSIMLWLGFMVGRAFGWTPLESFVAGAIVAISSTTIIAKVFEEQGIRGKLREVVVGVLIVEDLIAILLMAVLSAISTGKDVSAATLFESGGRLAAFLAGLLVVGLLVVPRSVRAIVRLRRPETTLVATVGICFAAALLAQSFGYSVALGAFIAGSLVAESGEEPSIEPLIRPVRDMFAALFFVSVGMLIDPAIVVDHWPEVLSLTAVVVVGKIGGVSLGAFLTGHGVRTSIQAGMSLAQIGEFSFIIASLGIALGTAGKFLYPVAVAVSALTTLTTPWLIRAAGPVAAFVDRKLPHALQMHAALYGSWVEQLRTGPRAQSVVRSARRLAGMLLLDIVLLAGLVVGTTLGIESIASAASNRWSLRVELARLLLVLGAALLATPLVVGIVRVARRLGTLLAESAFPKVEQGSVDFAAAPRRALVITLQIAILLLVGLPLLAVTQPFLPGWPPAIALAVLVAILGLVFWRRAANLKGHVTAGAQMIVEALSIHASRGSTGVGDHSLVQVRKLLPGLGEPVALRVEASSSAVGKTLAEVNVRGLTGATVLAILRGDQGVVVPEGEEVLRAGDVLALAGTQEAVSAARELLAAGAGIDEDASEA